MKNEIKSFFDQFQDPLNVKVCVVEKTEYYILAYRNQPIENCLKVVSSNLGRTSVNLLYDKNFELFTALLVEDSEGIMQAIKDTMNDVTAWIPLYNLAREILVDDDCHPYYLFLLKEIVNAYKTIEQRTVNIIPSDDHFKKIGLSYASVKEKIVALLKLYENHDDIQSLVQAAVDGNVFCMHYPLSMGTEKTPAISSLQKSGKLFWSVLYPNTPEDLWYYLLPKILESNLWFRRCQNCKRFFVTTSQSNARFCEHIIEGKEKSCRELMPKVNLMIKSKEDPAANLYNRAYKTMYSRVSAGSISKAAYKEWSKAARQKRNECSKGLMTPEAYSAWLCDSGLFIDYLKEN